MNISDTDACWRLASQNLTKEVLFVFVNDGKGVGFVAVLGLLSHCVTCRVEAFETGE